jgi:hypothetical protein
MDRNTLKKIFAFIEEKEGKTSLAYKILYDFDNIRDNELIINGNLDLSNKNITSLPFGLQVYGYLILLGCTSLTSLPDGLQVGGYLVLSGCTSLTTLPDGLKVGDKLNLRSCTSLTTLPDGLQVGGNLNIANTPLANYTDGELLKMIGSTGYMNGIIKRKWRG